MLHTKLPEPWASMTCSGLVDVFDIDVGTSPCLVLVEAVNTPPSKQPKRTHEWHHATDMARALGLIPMIKTPPGIVGAFFAHPTTYRDSVWAYGSKGKHLCRVVRPMLFPTPLAPNTTLTEEQVLSIGMTNILPRANATGTELILPLYEQIFHNACLNGRLSIELTDEIAETLFSRACLVDYRVLTLISGNHSKSFVFEDDNDYHIIRDKQGNPFKHFSTYRMKDIVPKHFMFHLRTRIF